MRIISEKELMRILEEHKKWLNCEGGKRRNTMKMYDMRCPSCKEFAGFKNNNEGRPKCEGCGYVMTNEDTKEVLDAVWKEHEKDQQDEKCISCEETRTGTVINCQLYCKHQEEGKCKAKEVQFNSYCSEYEYDPNKGHCAFCENSNMDMVQSFCELDKKPINEDSICHNGDFDAVIS